MTSQVGIGTASPDPAAALDINSQLPDGTYGGLKLPTINEADKSSIATPIPDGLMLYVVDGLERCVEIYDANTSSWVTFYCMNLVPLATNVNVLDDGTPQITETLTTDFDETSASFQTDNENDAPSTPLYQWYRADDAAGLNEVAIAAPEGIAATYTLVAADNDKFIRLGIRPTASAGASPGIEVFSAYTAQIDYLSTIIEFDPQLATLAENASPDDIDLVFEFPNVSTTAIMVTVASDDYTRLDETGPVTITIPANQTSPFTTTVFNIENNGLTDGTASLTFTITNVTGGLGPNSIGTDDTDLWDITDDDGFVATASDLFISEYVEGSGNNKYIEIANFTGTSVNLAGYELRLYANGATSPNNTEALSGTLANGAVLVFRNNSATIYSGTTTASSVCNFNGNDVIALFNGSTLIDSFGNIGDDPGSQWNVSGNESQDQTLRRNSGIGPNNSVINGFPTIGSEWTEFPQNDDSGLGSHTF